ncbi:SprT family zinc-dependent metalloprotease [Nevskia sp.]|uniref:M48 family metallopeptidase n=1 Tax=Nevskia sp. TaxID=1929292 RepID=UPI0025E518AB|nr:SprT family zinc-dependent metalloprotease [Nevskia sp.]
MADLLGPFAPLQLTERVSARARNIRIEVRPDGNVLLVIPKRVPRATAHAFLKSREAWIRDKLVELKTRAARIPLKRPMRWDGSDTISLRGREMNVRVVLARLARPTFRFADDIQVFCSALDLARPEVLATALRTAIAKLARHDARMLLEAESARLGVSYEGPRIADQKSLWGSCTPDGLISLNWRLVMAPPEALRYVVIHELCHRRHLDHSPRFWRLVEKQMADHAHWRAWLREHGAALHAVLPKAGVEPPPAGLFDGAL